MISASLSDWGRRREIRIFNIALLDSDPLPPILLNLNLECLKDTDAVHYLEGVNSKDVFRILFAAAQGGGALGGGALLAYGRLFAWRSLAGLVGCSETASTEDIEMEAKKSRWCIFASDSDWFYEAGFDFGISCFNPANNDLAILAASSTD